MDMSKYDCVLQPLRQLEEVWGIDLASTLQAYAAEVAEVTVEFGGQALNFAQAALLIMGASSIYSKKVDALQALVQETYELIINRQKEKGDKQGDGAGGKKRRRKVVLREAVKFLAECHALHTTDALRQDIADVLRMHLTGSNALGVGLGGGMAQDVMRIAEGELVPLENTATGGFNFRTSVAQTAMEGLLLPNVRQELIGNLMYENDEVTPARHGVRMPPTPGSTIRSGNILPEQQRKEEGATDEEDLKRLCAQELRKALAEQLDSSSDDESVAPPARQKSQNPSHRGDQDDAKSDRSDDDNDVPQDPADACFDEIMGACTLDRFAVEADKAPERPQEQMGFREGRATLPPVATVLETEVPKAGKGKAESSKWAADAMGCLLLEEKMRARPVQRGELVEDTSLALALVRRERELEQAEARRRRAQEAAAAADGMSVRGADDAVSQHAMEPERPMEGAAIDVGLANVDHFAPIDAEGLYPSPACSDMMAGEIPPLTPCSGRGSVEPPALGPASPHAADDLAQCYFNADITRMNDMLHASHVVSNEQQARITHDEAALQQRVGAWQEHLEPLLAQESARPPYDIHCYARRLLDAFDEQTPKDLNFQDLLYKCCDGDFEISRFFLALLQLSNTKNVKLDVVKRDDVRQSDNIHVTLLTKTSVFNFDAEDVAMQMGGEPPAKRVKR